jgi:hypothetical protein
MSLFLCSIYKKVFFLSLPAFWELSGDEVWGCGWIFSMHLFPYLFFSQYCLPFGHGLVCPTPVNPCFTLLQGGRKIVTHLPRVMEGI